MITPSSDSDHKLPGQVALHEARQELVGLRTVAQLPVASIPEGEHLPLRRQRSSVAL
jgi:hypothetical protein